MFSIMELLVIAAVAYAIKAFAPSIGGMAA